MKWDGVIAMTNASKSEMNITRSSVAIAMTAPVATRVIRGCAKRVSIQERRQNKIITVSAGRATIALVASRVISGCAKSALIQENHQNKIKMTVMMPVIAPVAQRVIREYA